MSEANCNYILEIKFISFRGTPQINQMKFNNTIYKVTHDAVEKIELPISFFVEGESKNSSIKLLKDSVLVNECILEIFKGANYFYCFIDEKGYTFQLLFFKILPNIRIPLYQNNYYDITNYDTNMTLNRKRYTFINANFHSLLIDEMFFIIPFYINELKSYQMSIYDIKKNLVVTRPLILEEPNNFFQYFKKYYSLSCEFGEKSKNFKNKKKLENLLNRFQDLNLNFFLNKNKQKLINIFDNELFVDFYANISLYKVIDKFQTNDSIKEIIEYYLKKINEIKENKSMKIYQKILLIECFIGLCNDCKSKKEIEEADFHYYLMEEKEKNSVLDLVEQFFKEYRDKLTEESPVFGKLIELDGDSGFYQNESFYCFNMQNLDEIKKHLKEIETDIFVTHELNNKDFANTDIISGLVSVNVHNIKQYKLLDYPLNKALPDDKKEIGEIVASKIVYYLLHEINGHKKFSFKKDKYFNSPTKFIENGEIYTLCEKDSEFKGENMIRIVPKGKIGEDGYFYELIYGKINDYYTFEIMDNVDDFSDLLHEVDLWVNKLDKLQEYIKYKFALQNYGSNFKSKKTTIEEKINDYKNECLKLQNIQHINMDTFFTKKSIIKYKNKKVKDTSKNQIKNTNKKKEKFDTENDFHSSKEIKNEGKIKSDEENEQEKKEDKKDMKEKEEEEEEEENEEEEMEKEEEIEKEEEEYENKDKIEEQKKKENFWKLPFETLLTIEQSGILTKKQISLMKKRKRSLLRTVRYKAEIDNNI